MTNKWDRILAARAARQQNEEIEVEEISALNLIEAILDERPGNFKTVFEQLMQDRLQDLVSEAKQYYAASLIGEQEVDDDELDWDDEEEIPEEDEEVDLSDEEEIDPLPDNDDEEEEVEDQIDEVRWVNRDMKAPKGKFLASRKAKIKEQDGHLRGVGTTMPGGPGHLPGPAGQKNKQPGQIGTRPPLHNRVQKTDVSNTKPEQSPSGHSSDPGNVYDKTLSKLKSMSGKTATIK